MKLSQFLGIILVSVLLLMSCSTVSIRQLNSNLVEVKGRNTDKIELGDSNYKDEIIDVSFEVRAKEIQFSMRNLTSTGIKINLDEVILVDAFGNSNDIIHSGVKFSKTDVAQKPSVIAPNGVLSDIIVNKNTVFLGHRLGTGSPEWKRNDLFNLVRFSDEQVETLVGENFSIYFPIYMGDTKIEYSFVFNINSITATTEKRALAD